MSGAMNAPQPLIGPLTVTMCRSPGGIQPARCGGNSQEPCSVRLITRPCST